MFHRNGSPIQFPEIFQPRLESQLRAQVAWDRFDRGGKSTISLTRIVRQEAGTFYFDGVERPNTPDVLYGLGVERTRFLSRLELTTGSTLVRELNRHFAGDAWNLNIMVGVRYHPGK